MNDILYVLKFHKMFYWLKF